MPGFIPNSQRDRSAFWAVTGTILLTCALMLGTWHALDYARLTEAKQTVRETASGWANQLINHTPDLEQILVTGQTTPIQQPALRMAETYGQVRGYTLFSPQGDVLIARGASPDFLPLDERVRLAQTVAQTGVMQTTLMRGSEGAAKGVLDSITRIPLFDDAGAVIGVAELCTHHLNLTSSIDTIAGLIVLAIPVVSAFAFLIPMLIMIRLRRKSKLREEELAVLSRQDNLTGLMNRSAIAAKCRPLFIDRRDPAEQIGILMIDLDNFKSVNDLFSPAIADAYLCQTAERLLNIVGTAGFVGRTNGDEFMIILPMITRAALRRITATVKSEIAEPVLIQNETVICSASIGSHLSPVGQAMDRALHAADLALNHAVESGHGQVVEFVDALDRVTSRHNQIESYLRRSGFEELVDVYFQPFVDAKSGQIVGFEALARMRDEDGNVVRPDEFIPVAESTGLIHELGIVVLRKAMRAAKKWPSALYVSVNLSTVQFQDPELANRIIKEMDKVGLQPERLELELTESLLLCDGDDVMTMLQRLQNAGIHIAMDDFGTGYSSLGYLWKYNFDKIKIDRSFLLGHDFEQSRYFDIIETIILLGHKLGMSVTVEGVETRKQVDALTEMACDQFQGFYFSRPLTQAQTDAVVRSLYAPLQQTA